MASTKISLYNAALREIGSDKLASLSEDAERRYVLDDVYDDVLATCLEDAQWQFAMRAVEIAYDPNIDPAFGYSYAFLKPTDMVRLSAICTDENFKTTLEDYDQGDGYWLADVETIYVKYVSDSTSYGLDLSLWTPSFIRYVEFSLAERVVYRLTQSDTKREMIKKDLKLARTKARSIDAQSKAQRDPEGEGSWITARSRYGFRRYDRA